MKTAELLNGMTFSNTIKASWDHDFADNGKKAT
jgi:hypothetical protein